MECNIKIFQFISCERNIEKSTASNQKNNRFRPRIKGSIFKLCPGLARAASSYTTGLRLAQPVCRTLVPVYEPCPAGLVTNPIYGDVAWAGLGWFAYDPPKTTAAKHRAPVLSIFQLGLG